MYNLTKLLSLRDERGLTQAELSRRSGKSIQTISRIENGHATNVDTETIEKLAQALEVHPSVFLMK